MWFLITVATLGIAMLEIPTLWKRGWKKELWVFSILLLAGTGLSIAESLQMNLPNPQDAITSIFAPITEALFGMPK